jgi:hypothetical protein
LLDHLPTVGRAALRDERASAASSSACSLTTSTSTDAQERGRFRNASRERLKHLGAPPAVAPEQVATALLSLAFGLAQEKLIEPDAVPDELLGDMFALIYAGHVARAQR